MRHRLDDTMLHVRRGLSALRYNAAEGTMRVAPRPPHQHLCAPPRRFATLVTLNQNSFH